MLLPYIAIFYRPRRRGGLSAGMGKRNLKQRTDLILRNVESNYTTETKTWLSHLPSLLYILLNTALHGVSSMGTKLSTSRWAHMIEIRSEWGIWSQRFWTMSEKVEDTLTSPIQSITSQWSVILSFCSPHSIRSQSLLYLDSDCRRILVTFADRYRH